MFSSARVLYWSNGRKLNRKASNMQPWQAAKGLLAHAASFGFCRFAADANQIDELIQALRRLQFVVSSTSLQIKQVSNARPNTLSAKHGAGAFPFHTDFAFRPMPARYILLLNPTGSNFQRPTLIARLDKLAPALQQIIQNSIWKLVAPQKHFLVSGRFIRNDQIVWRWDCDFLAPVNSDAFEARRCVPDALSEIAEQIVWGRQDAVLIDNWYCAHARGEAKSNDQNEPNRALLRYEFWGDARMVL
jgi:hypothetical protein